MLSCVLIVPAALKDEADALGEALGHGPQSYTVALTTGEGVTHWGLHAFVSPDFVAMLQSGELPDGVEFPALGDVMAALISSVRADYAGHFVEILAKNNLQIADAS